MLGIVIYGESSPERPAFIVQDPGSMTILSSNGSGLSQFIGDNYIC